MANQRHILLTSTGLSAQTAYKFIDKQVDHLKTKSVAIITTASEDKEHNKYAKLSKAQFEELGFLSITFVDLETEPDFNFEPFDVMYVCGGNTFKLLKYAKDANLKQSIIKLLNRGGIYIGVSAGSIILGPSIEVASEILGDENEIELNDLQGLGIVDFVCLPHYDDKLEDSVRKYEEKKGVRLKRIRNDGVIII